VHEDRINTHVNPESAAASSQPAPSHASSSRQFTLVSYQFLEHRQVEDRPDTPRFVLKDEKERLLRRNAGLLTAQWRLSSGKVMHSRSFPAIQQNSLTIGLISEL
jgi:hypothetical protein